MLSQRRTLVTFAFLASSVRSLPPLAGITPHPPLSSPTPALPAELYGFAHPGVGLRGGDQKLRNVGASDGAGDRRNLGLRERSTNSQRDRTSAAPACILNGQRGSAGASAQSPSPPGRRRGRRAALAPSAGRSESDRKEGDREEACGALHGREATTTRPRDSS
jgi:hypothetical protein